LATRRDAGSELEYATELLNAVIAGVDGVRTGIHVCRGNWSRREDVLLSGDYAKLVPAFARMRVQQFVLEYATPRAGDAEIVGRALAHREIGLGVVNPRTDEAEDPAEIVRRVERILPHFSPEEIFLNPDCGFGCFASRCVNDEHTATKKLASMVEAARRLRARHG
jgi:5-methyltetrahydropteroyltriglutamate--homocysteine methyltransferase